MRPRQTTLSPRAGTTLIEVLAGLVVLGTLLASVAIARGRFVRQWADADHRLAAADEIDRLMTGWLAGPPAAVPISSRGYAEGPSGHLWVTRVIPSPAAASVGSIVVRLELFQRSPDQSPLGRVDFMLPTPAPARGPRR